MLKCFFIRFFVIRKLIALFGPNAALDVEFEAIGLEATGAMAHYWFSRVLKAWINDFQLSEKSSNILGLKHCMSTAL